MEYSHCLTERKFFNNRDNWHQSPTLNGCYLHPFDHANCLLIITDRSRNPLSASPGEKANNTAEDSTSGIYYSGLYVKLKIVIRTTSDVLFSRKLVERFII